MTAEVADSNRRFVRQRETKSHQQLPIITPTGFEKRAEQQEAAAETKQQTELSYETHENKNEP